MAWGAASPVPPHYRGVWVRRLLESPQGRDETTSVHWLQASVCHADLRIPAGEPRSTGAASTRAVSSGEFDSVRPYRRGDPLKAIVWKKAAKTDELVSRDSQQSQAVELWLDLALAGGGALEQRLARLCAWVLACVARAKREPRKLAALKHARLLIRLPLRYSPPHNGGGNRRPKTTRTRHSASFRNSTFVIGSARLDGHVTCCYKTGD